MKQLTSLRHYLAILILLMLPLVAVVAAPDQGSTGLRAIFVRWHLSIEILAALWWLAIFPRRRALSFFVIIGTVAYEVYDLFVAQVFHRQANFANDLWLVPDGLNLALDLLPTTATRLAALGTVALLLTLTWWLVRSAGLVLGKLWRGTTKRRRRQFTVACLGVAVAIHVEHSWAEKNGLLQSTSLRLAVNLSDSAALVTKLRALQTKSPAAPKPFPIPDLDGPSVFVAVIESYGQVLLERPDLHTAYNAMISRFRRRVSENGWHLASALSRSPVTGGASWQSSATILSGIHIDSQPLYQRMIADPPLTIVDAFSAAGYHTLWIASANRARPGRPLANPYRFDETFFWDRIAYEGPRYGWGVVPDHVTLERAKNQTPMLTGAPTFTYFVSVTSHAPWDNIPNLETDASKQSEQSKLSQRISRVWGAEPSIDGYIKAIKYELSVIETMALAADDNVVFWILGDHQPPQLTDGTDFSTPLHFLTKNKEQLERLQGLGFVETTTENFAVENFSVFNHAEVASIITWTNQRDPEEGFAPFARPAGILFGR